MLQKIKNILNYESGNFNLNTLMIGFFFFLSGLLGLLRNNLLASRFGAGDQLDIYFASFKIPDLIFNLLIFGAISVGFIPSFLKEWHKDKEKAWDLVNNFFHFIVFFSLILIILLIILMPIIVPVIAPGFSNEKIKAIISLSRLLLIQPLFLGMAAVFSGVLQSFKKFLAYSLAPLFYNLGIIGGIIFLVPPYGLNGLIYGVIIGAFFNFLIQLVTVYQSGFKYQFIFNLKNQVLRQIIKLTLPRSFDLLISQANLVLITVFSSYLASGSLTIISFARDLTNFVVTLFAVSFAVSSFPVFTTLVNQGNYEELKKFINQVIVKILFFSIPIAGIFLIFRAPIVKLIFSYGQFTAEHTLLTIQTLGFLALSIIPLGLTQTLIRIFFSLSDTKTPFFVSLITFIMNIILMSVFSKTLGVPGLALTMTITSFFQVIVLIIILQKKINWFEKKLFLGSIKEIFKKILKN
ncbi:murein biosynthesis integral membrane protein MurJ [Candidatus Azambacteria bacterium]|nr:murein biosynthesis integral membrane protein MurJ [Candidatus Azambacteria bacterium]